jgi:hypothetical protein
MSPLRTRKRNTIRAVVLVIGIAAALSALTGCSVASTTPAATPAIVSHGKPVQVVESKAALMATACGISKNGKLTANSSQEMTNYGKFLATVAAAPGVPNPATGAATKDEALKLSAMYVSFGEHVFAETLNGHGVIPVGIKAQLDKICAGDLTAAK